MLTPGILGVRGKTPGNTYIFNRKYQEISGNTKPKT
jgi:hypothetical protein